MALSHVVQQISGLPPSPPDSPVEKRGGFSSYNLPETKEQSSAGWLRFRDACHKILAFSRRPRHNLFGWYA